MKNVFIAVCFCININIKFFNPLMKCNTHLNYMLSTQSITFLGRFFQYFFYLQKVVQWYFKMTWQDIIQTSMNVYWIKTRQLNDFFSNNVDILLLLPSVLYDRSVQLSNW